MPSRRSYISYLGAMLRHPTHLKWGLACVLSTALLAGLGFSDAALVPIVLFAAGEVGAALWVPYRADFRRGVEASDRRRVREGRRRRLERSLRRRRRDNDPRWRTYRTMRAQAQALAEIAQRRETDLSPSDVEAFERATVRYLGYWEAHAAAESRLDPKEIQAVHLKLQTIDARIERSSSARARAKLVHTQGELRRLVEGFEFVRAHRDEVEAMMLRMTQDLDAIYRRVVSQPEQRGIGDELEAVADRLQVTEALDAAVEQELRVLVGKKLRPAPVEVPSARGD